MSRTKIVLLCVPLALAGVGFAVHASFRVRDQERELAVLAAASEEAGRSFVQTLQGEHAERQRVAFDKRRALALSLAAARRDRLLGVLAIAGAGLAAAALSVFARIAAEVEEDRRHVHEVGSDRGPDRS